MDVFIGILKHHLQQWLLLIPPVNIGRQIQVEFHFLLIILYELSLNHLALAVPFTPDSGRSISVSSSHSSVFGAATTTNNQTTPSSLSPHTQRKTRKKLMTKKNSLFLFF
jgi:hypothetical protein